MSTPDFEMPPEAVGPPPAPAGAPRSTTHAPDPTAEPDEAVARPPVPWRRVVIAGLIGVLVGATAPAALQAVDDASARAQAEALRSTAMAYLAAIADGEAARATAIVPIDGELPPDPVLRSAERIEGGQVQVVSVEGDRARVGVSFAVGRTEQLRQLAAERLDGAWTLTTSLAEQVTVHSFDGSTGPSIGGVELPADRRVLLYPGVYTADALEGPLLRAGGERFLVDGDAATPSELLTVPELTEPFRDAAIEVANARVAACLEQPDCPYPAGSAVPLRAAIAIDLIDAAGGTIDLSVPLADGTALGQWHQPLRAIVDGSGAVVSWECGAEGRPHHALAPCAP